MHCQSGAVVNPCGRSTRRHESRCQDSSKPASRRRNVNHLCPSEQKGPAQAIKVAKSGKLDTELFTHFRPLLEVCQDYAELTGCRFHGISFEAESLELLQGVFSEGDLVLSASGIASLEKLDDPLLVAELRAMPVIHDYTRRLRGHDRELLSDLSKAFQVMMAEGVRNSFRGTCRELGLWPPVPAPPGIPADDCCYEDVVEELPVIAQRLYNDEAKRARMLQSTASSQTPRVQAATASFVVDFAHMAGVELPEMPTKYQELLKEFNVRVCEWQQQHHEHPVRQDWEAADIFIAADMLRSDIKKWLERRRG